MCCQSCFFCMVFSVYFCDYFVLFGDHIIQIVYVCIMIKFLQSGEYSVACKLCNGRFNHRQKFDLQYIQKHNLHSQSTNLILPDAKTAARTIEHKITLFEIIFSVKNSKSYSSTLEFSLSALRILKFKLLNVVTCMKLLTRTFQRLK